MKKALALLLAAIMSLSLAACSGTSPAASDSKTPDPVATTDQPASTEPIYIGLTDAFSGERAINGEYTKEGVELFLSEINAAGGVLGREVVVVYEDDQGTEASATNAYQKLISDNDVSAVVLNKYSSLVLAVEQFVAEAEIPAICSGSSVKLEALDNEYMLSTRRSDSGSGLTIAAYCEKLGATKVAILHANDALGTGMAPVVASALAGYGIEVVSTQQFATDEKNFAPYIAKIIDSGCDMLVSIAQTNEAPLIMRAVKDAGLDIPCIGSSASAQSSTLQNAVGASEGWYSVTAFSPTISEGKAAEWIAKYEKMFGRAPDMTSATTYDALSMICWAIEEAGSTDPKAINTALHSIKDFEGISSVFTYQGTPMLSTAEYVSQVQNGESVVLEQVAAQ